LYYVRTAKLVLLLRVYPKTSRSDLPPELIRTIIEEYERSA